MAPDDRDPVHVFDASDCGRVMGDVVLVRAPTWRDAQGELPDEDYDEDDLTIEDDGAITGLRLDAEGDYPALNYRGTWSEAGEEVELTAKAGENLSIGLIPHDDEQLAGIATDLQEIYQQSDCPEELKND